MTTMTQPMRRRAVLWMPDGLAYTLFVWAIVAGAFALAWGWAAAAAWIDGDTERAQDELVWFLGTLLACLALGFPLYERSQPNRSE